MHTKTGTIRTRLPLAFYDDHVERDLPAGKVLKRLTKHVDVELTWPEYAEVLSDARHYRDSMGDWTGSYANEVRRSARDTVKVLERYGVQDFAVDADFDFGC